MGTFDELLKVPERGRLLTQYLIQLKKDGLLKKGNLELCVQIMDDMKYVGDTISALKGGEITHD